MSGRLPVPENLEGLIPAEHPRRPAFVRAMRENLSEEHGESLNRLLDGAGFGEFIRKRLNISESRFEHTLGLFFRRLALEISPDLLDDVAGAMASDHFREIEKSFFLVPPDPEGYRIFERGFLQTGEQNHHVLAHYLEFCGSDEFTDLRKTYWDTETFSGLLGRLINLLLGRKSVAEVRERTKDLCLPAMGRGLELTFDAGTQDKFLGELFTVFHEHAQPGLFMRMLKTLLSRYHERGTSFARQKLRKLILERMRSCWDWCKAAESEAEVNEFREFLKAYGEPEHEFQSFVWDVVAELDGERAKKAAALFITPAFSGIHSYYSADTGTLKLITRKIITALLEMDVRDFRDSMHKIVLKLLLGLKPERSFLKRRGDFFEWLRVETGSRILEMEVVRFLFFEYIFLSLGQVSMGPPLRMSRYCDDSHRFFCEHLDVLYTRRSILREKTESTVFRPILDMLRRRVWSPVRERFQEYEYRIDELAMVGASLQAEDLILAALEHTEEDDLPFYHQTVMEAYRVNPEHALTALDHDYWYRLPFEKAVPELYGIVFSICGAIEIRTGDMGAYTDGRVINLPEYVNDFKDPLEPREEFKANRNLAMYAALALHECGHIVGGSFRFNLRYYLTKLEWPALFRTIMNIFEDYRIEEFLIRIRAHPQVEDLLRQSNEFYTVTREDAWMEPGPFLLFHIFDEAAGYNHRVKHDEEYEKALARVRDSSYNTGRFRSMDDLIAYGINRLQGMDLANPLAAYPLSREFYEIMKHWPAHALEGLLDDDLIRTGRHALASDGEGGLDGEGSSRPLTREELDDLYRQYNENPREFLERHDLPVYPELFGEEAGPESAGTASPRTSLEQFTEKMQAASPRPDYRDEGTIDLSTRTKADDLAALRQTEAKEKPKKPGLVVRLKNLISAEKGKGPSEDQENPGRDRFVYSLDPRTKSRTRLSHIREFQLKDVDNAFLIKFRKWEYLAERVYRLLARMIPNPAEELDTSRLEGELNLERLIEILASKNAMDPGDYLDIHHESRRSLEAIIGLDCSGSTDLVIQPITEAVETKGVVDAEGRGTMHELDFTPEQELKYDTVLDIEKAFALIFGRALEYLTERVEYYAFNSVMSTNVYRAQHREAITSVKADWANRDGDFIRYIKGKLEQSSADVRYFFLISDGMPMAENYTGKEALDDTLFAMRETRAAGIKLIYLNIDPARAEYFDAFKNEAVFAEHFRNPDELLPAIPRLVRAVVEDIS